MVWHAFEHLMFSLCWKLFFRRQKSWSKGWLRMWESDSLEPSSRGTTSCSHCSECHFSGFPDVYHCICNSQPGFTKCFAKGLDSAVIATLWDILIQRHLINKNLRTPALQAGNGHGSAQRRPSSGKWPSLRLHYRPEWQEPPCVAVQLQGRSHHGICSFSPCSTTKVLTITCLSAPGLFIYGLSLPQALLASSYVPFYAGLNPVEFRGKVTGWHTQAHRGLLFRHWIQRFSGSCLEILKKKQRQRSYILDSNIFHSPSPSWVCQLTTLSCTPKTKHLVHLFLWWFICGREHSP